MPRSYRFQSSFTRGVLDANLLVRTDVEAYYQALAEGENIIPLVQGGFSRRPGLEYLATISGVTGDKVRIIPFRFNVEQAYIFVMKNLQIQVFKDGVSVATFATPWPAAALFDVRYTQTADTMILVHPDYAPRKIVRGATDASWTISTIAFSNIPQYDFNDSSSPTPTSEIQTINMAPLADTGDDFIIDLEGFRSETLTYDKTNPNEMLKRFERALYALPNTPRTGITVTNVGEVYTVTFANEAARDYDLMIVKEVNTGTAVCTVTETQSGVSRAENIMSATRGWPRTVTFHEGRLWFGGFRELPQTIVGSVIGDFFNLDIGTGLDDDAIQVTIDTDEVNAIQALYSGRNMYVFTSGGEFVTHSPENIVLTPSNITIRRNTRHGSGSVQPVSIDGTVAFLERNGKVLRQFAYDVTEDTYSAPMLSIFSSSQIKQPTDMAAFRGSTNEQSNYVYLVNADGTVAILNMLREQNILSWVPWETDGEFRSVAVIDDDVYFVSKRDGAFFLERTNPQLYMDAGMILSPASDTVTGLGHLEGKTVRVLADGAVQPSAVVSGGSITLSRVANTVQVGLGFSPRALTMPLNADFQDGPTLTRRKRFVEASLNVSQTRGLVVDNTPIPDRQLNQDQYDNVPASFTGIKQVYVHGWTDLAQIEIRQDDPLPMTVLGLTLEVSLT